MEIDRLKLEGLSLLKPKVYGDTRGSFLESYSEPRYREVGVDCPFVQDNQSISCRNTLRGLHFQSEPGQAKLVRVVQGKIFDVAVDIRPESPTFGQWEGVILDDESHHQLFVPIGFAHGFCVLSELATVLYKVSSPYNPATEMGFRWDDPEVGIEWPIDDPILSDRDQDAPPFSEIFAPCTSG